MTLIDLANRGDGIALRHAALIAGFGMLIMSGAAPFAQLYVFPKLVIPGDIGQTAGNIVAHQGLFLAAIFCYLYNFVCDIVISWALYLLLAPVNRAVSLLAAWFRLVYTAVCLFGVFKLLNAYHLLTTPRYVSDFGTGPLHAQVQFLLDSYQYEWSMGLILFAIYLCLLGWLVYRSKYIPGILGVLLTVDGFVWLVDSLRPYLFPQAHLGFLMSFPSRN